VHPVDDVRPPIAASREDRLYVAGMIALAGVTAAAAWRRRPRLAAAAGAALAFFAQARWFAPRRVKLTRLRLPWRGPRLRVAFLSDLHGGSTPSAALRRAVALARAARPDVILLGGDYVEGHDAEGFKLAALAPLGELRAPLGVFAILGNHDSEPAGDSTPRAGAVARRLGELGVELLHNRRRPLPGGVALVGLADHLAGETDAGAAFAGADPAAPTLVLAHHWRSLGDPGLGRFDLALTGHTHGGQACLPGTGICPPHAEDMKPYRAGLYDWPGGGKLFVGRGLGMSGVRARIGAPPEVAIIDLA
jgi:predicted MPP superfamily phosphohydrolase